MYWCGLGVFLGALRTCEATPNYITAGLNTINDYYLICVFGFAVGILDDSADRGEPGTV